MIQKIRLQNYRSYSNRDFQFSPGVNIISGPNGSGKTNLLEAILLLCQGRSYRASDNELIRHNQPWSRVDAVLQDGSTRTVKLQPTNRISKEMQINNKLYKRLDNKLKIPVVFFEPNHLMIVSGSPVHRRNYLDEILDQTNPDFAKIRLSYTRVLRQRNRLIKQNRTNYNELFPWNVRLSQLGGQIANARNELITILSKDISDIYSRIAEDPTVIELKYVPSVEVGQYESKLLKKLETHLELDILRGSTTYGPHREDMTIQLNNSPLQSVASRGEARTVMVALKILEQQIKQTNNQRPILLFDDVFSELDNKRSLYLTRYIKDQQAFITATNTYSIITKSSRHINLD